MTDLEVEMSRLRHYRRMTARDNCRLKLIQSHVFLVMKIHLSLLLAELLPKES
jgi:hypothetical protein